MLNRDDIIKMMRDAALPPLICDSPSILALCEAVARRSAAVEREACAKVCEAQITGGDYHYLAISGHWDNMAQAAINCAAAIRARSQT